MKTLIEHLIISHHGQYDFGSPKLPMFPEALMLHYLDDLDSKMESMRAHFERETDMESAWTAYNPSLGRPLLNTKKFLEKKIVDTTASSAVKSQTTESETEAPTSPSADVPGDGITAAPLATSAYPDKT
jgi:3'-5' exoribonuclease